MRTVRMLGQQRVEVVDVPEPEPEDGSVVVKVMASALCGTERHAYYGAEPLPTNAGHEASGVVWKTCGSAALEEGDRVILFATSRSCGSCRHCLSGRWILCRTGPYLRRDPAGAHSQFMSFPEKLCLPFPESVRFDVATLISDALGTPFRALDRLRVSAVDRVVVVGQGPIGLAATLLCRFMGAFVVAVDINEYRLERARQCGADVTLNPERDDVMERVWEITNREGADVALECSATPAGAHTSLDSVRSGGRVAFIGLTPKVEIDVTAQLILKDLEAVGTWYSNPADQIALLDLMRRGLEPERIVSHFFPIEEADDAFSTFFGGEAAKVVLLPWD